MKLSGPWSVKHGIPPEEKDHSSFSLQYSVLNQCTSNWVDLIALRSHLHEAETQPRRFSNAAHHTGYERSKEFLKLVLSPFLWLGNVRPRNFISALHHYWVPQGLGCGRRIVPRNMNAQGTPLTEAFEGEQRKIQIRILLVRAILEINYSQPTSSKDCLICIYIYKGIRRNPPFSISGFLFESFVK